MSGYVYVFTNPSMPGLVKIGYTRRSVFERVDELSSTGVPQRFRIELVIDTEVPELLERQLHKTFSNQFYSKEFFKCDVRYCVLTIKEFAKRNPTAVKNISGRAAEKYITAEELLAIEKDRLFKEKEEKTVEEKRAHEEKIRKDSADRTFVEFNVQFDSLAQSFDLVVKRNTPILKRVIESGPVAFAALVCLPLVAMYGLGKSVLGKQESLEEQAMLDKEKWATLFSKFPLNERETSIKFVRLNEKLQLQSADGLTRIVKTFIERRPEQEVFSHWGKDRIFQDIAKIVYYRAKDVSEKL